MPKLPSLIATPVSAAPKVITAVVTCTLSNNAALKVASGGMRERGRWGDEGVWGVWGVWGEREFMLPPPSSHTS